MIGRDSQAPAAGAGRIRALIAESDPRLAAQVRNLLERRGVAVSAAVSFGSAMALAAEQPPDLLVADVDIERSGAGAALAAAIKRRWSSAVVLLASSLVPATLDAVAATDAAILTKPVDARQLDATLLVAIRRPPDHRSTCGPGFIAAEWPDRLSVLRPREREVVLLLSQKRVPAIADELRISRHTVRNHLKGAFRRTGTRSQQELLDWLHRAIASPAVAGAGVTRSGHPAPAHAADYPFAGRSRPDSQESDHA